ncbi:unnamed protein product [Symbiodinium natans]|uniref:Uncharacterized protein n=1 Tax=Symbiodinium natans TaxID=878477 RepID=A0A812N8Y8_9DINO|nr:unnamed protein product [Symbiodinium natans]
MLAEGVERRRRRVTLLHHALGLQHLVDRTIGVPQKKAAYLQLADDGRTANAILRATAVQRKCEGGRPRHPSRRAQKEVLAGAYGAVEHLELLEKRRRRASPATPPSGLRDGASPTAASTSARARLLMTAASASSSRSWSCATPQLPVARSRQRGVPSRPATALPRFLGGALADTTWDCAVLHEFCLSSVV